MPSRARDLVARGLPGVIAAVAAAATLSGAPGRVASQSVELGVISGHVRDPNGNPIGGVTVRALKSRLLAGRRLLEANSDPPSSRTMTDTDGAYELSVPPGRYAVAAPASALPGGRDGPGPARGGHPTVFFPGITAASDASLLTLAAGATESGIDFTIARTPLVRVSGALGGPDAVPGIALQLERDEPGDTRTDVDVMKATSGADGQFAFDLVPPGRYRLRVVKLSTAPGQPVLRFNTNNLYIVAGDTSTPLTGPLPGASEAPALWADVPVDVSDEGKNVDDLSVWLQPGVRVSGRVIFEATGAPKPPPVGPAPPAGLTSLLALIPVDDPGRATPPGRVEKDGTFLLPSVPPGRYAFLDLFIRQGWTARKVDVGGRDMRGRVLTVLSELSGVTVTMTDAPAGTVSGAVRGPDGTAASDATVYLFPRDRLQWADFSDAMLANPWFHAVRPDAGGLYQIGAVPPGDYLVAAVSGAKSELWGEPDLFVSLAASAVPVHIAFGDARRVDLTAR